MTSFEPSGAWPMDPANRIGEPLTYEVQYLPELGEVHSYWHSKLDEVIQVRLELKEKLLRETVIVELERLGYTITPPTGDTP